MEFNLTIQQKKQRIKILNTTKKDVVFIIHLITQIDRTKINKLIMKDNETKFSKDDIVLTAEKQF
jgi:ABC-type molybdate transport system substrate-binding protein